jgi:hypothetical protein
VAAAERVIDATGGVAPGTRKRRAGTEPDTPAGDGGGLVRITVNLTPKAFGALTRSCEATGDSKTDTINRALLVYDLVRGLADEGGGSITMVNPQGERERLHLL